MKKFVLTTMATLFSLALFAQLQTPQPSPSAKLEQKVGLTDVTIEYSRPAMRGRTIFGDLVPFNKLWRTGANANTKISFSDDIIFGGQKVKAGTYAIYSKPGSSSWEVLLYSDSGNWGVPQDWDAAKVVATAEAEVEKNAQTVESFSISIQNLNNAGASLVIAWENTQVSVAIEVPTHQKVMASIEKVMQASPQANDYYGAAVYYLQENLELKQAKNWIEKAVELRPEAFWMMRQQSLIYAKMGQTKAAIAAAKKSLAAAEKAGNADYVKMNKESIAAWSK